MDTSDPDIRFDQDGICNHCHNYQENIEIRTSGARQTESVNNLVREIKRKGKGKEYDCIIGVSGGADSTYVAYKCKELGLRPLAVHFDNGWDSELAIRNIEKVLKNLNIDLFTYVIDWEEFRDLQIAFLKASTPDSEIPTDHAIYALLMDIARQKRIKYVISGMNYRTESIMPINWSYGHSDWKYIRGIQHKFGRKKLKHFPHYSMFYLFYITFIKNIRFISLLNYIEYRKEEVVGILEKELGWRNYGGKHHESIYTRFFQSYILPEKFGIDKRKAHLSNLINSGQLTKDVALNELSSNEYKEKYLREDRVYVIKKLKMTEQDFDEIMKLPFRKFSDYPNNYFITKKLKTLINYSRKKGFLPK